MAMNTSVWSVCNDSLEPLPKKKLDLEGRLEQWVAGDPQLVGLDVCIIGRQVKTAFGGRIDLLGIDQDGDLAVIELKRDKTPRDVVAQLLDYASWIDSLGHEEVDQIAIKHGGKPLSQVFKAHFEDDLPETINGAYKLVIVATKLDDASERIARFLAKRYGLDINAVFFNVFEHDGKELLARSWLMDPETGEMKTPGGKRPPWPGTWYVNLGEQFNRSWEDRRKYGFVSAGGRPRHHTALQRLKTGSRLFAFITGHGYVGYGEVTQECALANDFVPDGQEQTLSELPLEDPILTHASGEEEYAVGVRWIDIVSKQDAKKLSGMFTNQNAVCKLRHPETLAFLKKEFPTAGADDRLDS